MTTVSAILSGGGRAFHELRVLRTPLAVCLLAGIALAVPDLLGRGVLAQDKPPIDVTPAVPHSNRVSTVKFSADGKLILSGSYDKTLKLWDSESGRLIRTLNHGGFISVAAFAANDTRIISGAYSDRSIKVWDASTGTLLRSFFVDYGSYSRICISADGKYILSTGKGDTVKLWDAETGQVVREVNHLNLTAQPADSGRTIQLLSIAFSPDSRQFVSGSSDGVFKFWEVETGHLIRTVAQEDGTFAAVSPDGHQLLTRNAHHVRTHDPADYGVVLSQADTGQVIHALAGHRGNVATAAFSRDGAQIASGSWDTTINLYDAVGGKLIRSLSGHTQPVFAVDFSADGSSLASGGDDTTVRVWRLDNSEQPRTMGGDSAIAPVQALAISRSGGLIVAAQGRSAKLWNVRNGRFVRAFDHQYERGAVALSPNESLLASSTGRYRDHQLKIWEVSTGRLVRIIDVGSAPTSIAFSSTGDVLVTGTWAQGLKFWDVATGRMLRSFAGPQAIVWSVQLSQDGSKVLTGSNNTKDAVQLWDADSGALLGTFQGMDGNVASVSFSSDDSHVLAASRDSYVTGFATVWETATGRRVASLSVPKVGIRFATFSPGGAHVVSGHSDNAIRVWEVHTGKLVRTIAGHSGAVASVMVTADGQHIVSGSYDGTVRLWKRGDGEPLISLFAEERGEWAAVTAKGFFAGSSGASRRIGAVRGFQVASIAQFYDHLYRPDLVEQLLKGDPEGKYADEASKLDLEKILESGPAPQIEQLPERKTERSDGAVRMTVRIVDTGGGIGEKVVWRVNGVTQGGMDQVVPRDLSAQAGFRVVTETLKIDPSRKNLIEITAYNGAGLLATEAFRVEIDRFGVTTEKRPKMHVLAVGVSNYAQQDWRLQYAAPDAKALAQALKQVAGELYDEVNVSVVLDSEATADGIAEAINKMAAKILPADVFVLFVAGHGRSVAGTYYFLPQDLKFEGGRTVMSHGLSQALWQKWLARIPAQKSILVFDTCESSAAAGLTRGDRDRETAMDRLRHATGRSVITAARLAAYEGYHGHGVLTYAILEALTSSDGAKEEEVDLYQLAAHVDRQVPIISERLFGVAQRPHNKIEGNFPIGVRRAVMKTPAAEGAIPKTATHVLIRDERVREQPAVDAHGERAFPAGTQVRVVNFAGSWAIVARDGQKLGYVPAEALLRLQ